VCVGVGPVKIVCGDDFWCESRCENRSDGPVLCSVVCSFTFWVSFELFLVRYCVPCFL
jgi:hypothetical protein